MAVKLWSNKIEQFSDTTGVPRAGAKLFTYVGGSVNTKQTTYTESTGTTPNTNPIVLDSSGKIPQPIWLTTGVSYKFVLAPSTDTDPPTSPIDTIDVVTGINDSSASQSEWIAGPTPTYVSATQFTLVGDQTTNFNVGRRVKATVTAGTSYGTITASAFGALTTVTVDTTNSNPLDSGLSAVSYGILSRANHSVPSPLGNLVDELGAVRVGTAASLEASIALPNEPVNFTLSATVGSNALTIAVKTRGGSDPSASRPVLIPFRNATATTGDYAWLSLTAATSIVVPNTATLGTSNGVLARIWIVGFNDGGTFRLGVVNCLSGTNIFPLRDDIISSSTLTPANSAQVIYTTGGAVTSKAMRVLGYIEATEATAGTWATTPSKVQLFGPGVFLPNAQVQVRRTSTGAMTTGTTAVPVDDTIPQNTAGDQYMSLSITPSSAANVLSVEALGQLSNTNVGRIVGALFQDATASALAASQTMQDNTQVMLPLEVRHDMVAGTAVSTTFKYRAGGAIGATSTFNGEGGVRRYGGIANSFMRIIEIMS